GKGPYYDIRVFIDDAGLDLMRVDAISAEVAALQTLGPNGDVFDVCCLDMARHGGNTRRPVELQRSRPALDGGAQIEIGQAGSVVGMQVRGESNFKVGGRKSGELLLARGRGRPAHHSRAEIDEISSAVNHYGYGRPGAVRIENGCARAENHHLGLGGRLGEDAGCGA